MICSISLGLIWRCCFLFLIELNSEINPRLYFVIRSSNNLVTDRLNYSGIMTGSVVGSQGN